MVADGEGVVLCRSENLDITQVKEVHSVSCCVLEDVL